MENICFYFKAGKRLIYGTIGLFFALVTISCSGTTSASDFSFDLKNDGKGIIIKGYTGSGGKVVIPSRIDGVPVIEIAYNAFRGQSDYDYFPANRISEVVIPDTVVIIESYAFYWIDNLIKVTLPNNLKKIPIGAFQKCENLKTVNIPTGIEEIDWIAFNRCIELSNLIIPDSITAININEFSFVGCSKLPVKTRQRLQGLGYKGSF